MGDVNAAVERLLGGGLQVKLLIHCFVNSTIPFSGAEPWVKLFLCDGLEAILVTRRWARIK